MNEVLEYKVGNVKKENYTIQGKVVYTYFLVGVNTNSIEVTLPNQNAKKGDRVIATQVYRNYYSVMPEKLQVVDFFEL